MLAIRMRRMGSKKRPFFRIVVTESRTSRDSRFLEVLGHYNPRTRPETVRLDHERIAYWIKNGARPSDTVRTLVDRHPMGAAAATEPLPGPTDPTPRPEPMPVPTPSPEPGPEPTPELEAGTEQPGS
jgi:small subunit ribosomal protein S16